MNDKLDGQQLYQWWLNEFGACNCGQPDEAVRFLRDVLQLLRDLSHVVWPTLQGPDRDAAYRTAYKTWEQRESSLIPSPGLQMVVYYRLHALGLTEHGGSVPGWLSDKGHRVLDALERFGDDPDLWEGMK